mmetsp:Transcript_10370/g.33019  ORF Transcript_10370/g.33019 Transcript_10370/m.33019 type:complete len:274 (-) Transcript_10370:311-1132(-)
MLPSQPKQPKPSMDYVAKQRQANKPPPQAKQGAPRPQLMGRDCWPRHRNDNCAGLVTHCHSHIIGGCPTCCDSCLPPMDDASSDATTDVLEMLQIRRAAMPFRFQGGSRGGGGIPGWTVDLFTWLNFLWTTDVCVLSKPGELPLMLSYGFPPTGVPYYAVRRPNGNAQKVTLIGELGEGTGTHFEVISGGLLIKMVFERYGARDEYLLFHHGSRAARREARSLVEASGSYSRGTRCCFAWCQCCCSPCLLFRAIGDKALNALAARGAHPVAPE